MLLVISFLPRRGNRSCPLLPYSFSFLKWEKNINNCNFFKGRIYQEGETLPHSTGNCVECSCGPEGRIKCSPKDCVALKSEISPDNPSDGEFEVLRLDRNGEIDESF